MRAETVHRLTRKGLSHRAPLTHSRPFNLAQHTGRGGNGGGGGGGDGRDGCELGGGGMGGMAVRAWVSGGGAGAGGGGRGLGGALG